MKGYVSTTAGDIRAGDTMIDPVSGALHRVESVDPENTSGLVAIHARGCVSLSYAGFSFRADRALRRAPRPTDAGANVNTGDPYIDNDPDGFGGMPGSARDPAQWSASCACGMKSRASCATMCLKG